MGMTRSDLPNVRKLAPEVQRQAVDEMWRAYARGERRDPVVSSIPRHQACPLSYVATMAEMLEAALEVIGRG